MPAAISRPACTVLAPCSACMAHCSPRAAGRRWRQSLLLIATIVAGGVLAGVSVHGVVVSRLAAVQAEVSSYDHQTLATGAVRERLEMWRTARQAFFDHPLAG